MYGDWNYAFEEQKDIQLISWKRYSIGLLFLLVGIFLFLLPFILKNYSYIYPLLVNQPKASVKYQITTPTIPPTHILIPSVGINVPIIEAKVVNGYWELSDTTASHGVGSANPGAKGNMVIFAHARQGLFLALKDVQKEDVIYVYAKEKRYTYKVEKIDFVTPDQIQYISQTRDTRLTLFTCSGFWDEKRMIVEAKPI